MAEIVEKIKTFTAGEALAAYRRVKLSSSSGTQVEYSDAGQEFIGVTEAAAASGAEVAVRLWTPYSTFKMTASEATDLGDLIYGAVDGKVADTAVGAPIGRPCAAASAASSVIEVIPVGFTELGGGGYTRGIFSSAAAATGGIALSNSVTYGFRVVADDGGVALGTSAVKTMAARLLVTTATTDGSAFAMQSQAKVGAVNYNASGNLAGEWAYLETITGATLTGSKNLVRSGLMASVDVPSGATIAASSVASAIGIPACDLGGTHTGLATVLHVTNPASGDWDGFLYVSDSTGCTQASAAGSTQNQHLKLYINGTLYTVPCYTA